ncbi:decapping and exoribonuclease protein isoform X4 [Macaca fascicularis]|uniref:decapping and exoribonuclease protein isoform X4 n=1 Tax=Macaca fascicularis TaxID=9541 RepID=UPI003D15C1D8
MDPRGTKRGAEKTEVAEPRNKLPRPAPSLPTDPALYSGPFPFYRRPSELGCFSLDAQRQYHGDARALRYYSPPPTNGPGPNFDLRDGYPDRYQPRDEEVQERLDHLLCWLLEHRGRLEGGPGWLAEAIVTWRGHLTKLLTTPYERQEGWQLAASRFQGTLYLSEVETPKARAQRLARPPLLRELMYMGYKFEQYMCAVFQHLSMFLWSVLPTAAEHSECTPHTNFPSLPGKGTLVLATPCHHKQRKGGNVLSDHGENFLVIHTQE